MLTVAGAAQALHLFPVQPGRFAPGAGTRVRVAGPKDAHGEDTSTIVKAVELSDIPNLLFRRNSTTGGVEVLPRKGQTVELNEALHAN